MSLAEFRDELTRIWDLYRSDPEAAHAREDDLVWKALRAVAEDAPDAHRMARELAVYDVQLPDRARWCA